MEGIKVNTERDFDDYIWFITPGGGALDGGSPMSRVEFKK